MVSGFWGCSSSLRAVALKMGVTTRGAARAVSRMLGDKVLAGPMAEWGVRPELAAAEPGEVRRGATRARAARRTRAGSWTMLGVKAAPEGGPRATRFPSARARGTRPWR